MAINNISLTSGLRSNLISLQGTVDLLNQTQERLSSGLKVNSALDNPTNFFTAQSHRANASDLSGYKDGMNEAIQTIKLANTSIESLTALIESAKALANSAKTKTTGLLHVSETLTLNENLIFGDAITVEGTTYTAENSRVTVTATDVATAGDTIEIDGTTYTGVAGAATAADGEFSIDTGEDEMMASLELAIDYNTATTGISAAAVAGVITLTALNEGIVLADVTEGMDNTVAADLAAAGDYEIGATAALTATALEAVIPDGDFTATVSGADITLESIGDIEDVLTTTVDISGVDDADAVTETMVAAAGLDRNSLAGQYVELQSQIDDLITDSGYAGVNLLVSGEELVVNFGNEHSLSINGFDAGSKVGNADATSDWAANSSVETDITALDTALDSLRIEASSLSNNMSILTIRQDFSQSKINQLISGADSLTLADTNEEAANMLMLQTRQALGTTALSLSAQAAQSVLRLF